ncbi:trihelix transcription factor PTL [Cornus florida]|uniref:trihelix transcription factor PTL n=1 Tax=Cornus florida TaxID=4283 RepID=UPI002897E3C6|nr:trihelix transcription factor PTL [Cornus florida]
MEMEEQYGMADLRQFMNGRPHFPVTLQAGDHLFSGERNLTQAAAAATQQHYEMVRVAAAAGQVSDHMVSLGLHHDQFGSSCDYNNPTPTTTTTTTSSLTATCTASLNGLEMECGGNGRWPRQETLTLLEIRSRLDPKFKEANHQKGPLWDEISRMMSEEHGYQRSGKKCREKFENLYKYYKKTKEGKVGRQDGKHYRFFRQLEALYGKTSNPAASETTHLAGNSFQFHNGSNNNSTQCNNQEAYQAPKLSTESLSLCSSSDFDSSSSDDDNDSAGKRKKRNQVRRSWKAKIKDFIDGQMRKLLEKQEAWLEKLTETLEHSEQERMSREEEWRKQEAARVEREYKFWANERAWIEARDTALMEALQKITGKEVKAISSLEELRSLGENQKEIGSETSSLINLKGESWPECEVTRLIQLRTSMESRFRNCGCDEEVLWEEIAGKMGCLGYDHRNALMCKDKWNSINNYLCKTKESNKKRKEDSRSCFNFQNNEPVDNIQGGGYSEIARLAANAGGLSPNSSGSNGMHDNSCFRFLMGDGGNLWENYGVKLSKGEN